MIDPANEVAEGTEDNNLYQSWVDVQQKMPADTVAPVVHSVATGLSRYTTNVPVTIDASDLGAQQRSCLVILPHVGVYAYDQRLACDGGERLAIKADASDGFIRRTCVEVEHIFHARQILTGRFADAPAPFQPRLELVFFKNWRTVSGAICSTMPTSTALSASSRIVQRPCPDGGVLQAQVSSAC